MEERSAATARERSGAAMSARGGERMSDVAMSARTP